MGGYGAMKWALRCPDRFAAAASLSGALDVVLLQREQTRAALFDRVWGGTAVEGSDGDLMALLDRAAATVSSRPTCRPCYVCSGTEDVVFHHSRRFVDHAMERGIAITSDFGPGEHEWGYWDRQIQHVLRWLPLAAPAPTPPSPV